MSVNGLLTDVRWEWTGTELTADVASGEDTIPLLDPLAVTAGDAVWVSETGPYDITAVDVDGSTATIDPPLSEAVEIGDEVPLDIGGQPGQMWIAEVVLPDADRPIEVQLTVHDLGVMREGTYDPPIAILLSDDLERVENLPGSLPSITADYVPELSDLFNITLPGLQVELDAANAALDTLTTVTLPGLQDDLTAAQADLDTLNTVTIPGIASDLTAAQADITTLDSTVSGLATDLTAAQADIATLDSTVSGLGVDLGIAQGQLTDLNDTVIPDIDDRLHGAEIDVVNLYDATADLNALFPITSTNISDGAITTPKMTANSIDGDRITANTLNALKIVAGSITSDRMTANTITGDRIQANTLDAAKIVAGSITTDRMTANSINGDRVTANTLDAAKIVAGSITTDRMTANTINGDRVTANTLNASKIVAGSITSDRMTANTITGDRIQANTLDAAKIVAGSITTTQMTANTINGDRITANTLDAAKIVAGSITTDRMTANSINGDRIAANTLSVAKLIAGDTFTQNLSVASTFTLGTASASGTIQSYNFASATDGFSLTNSGFTLKGGTINAGLFRTAESGQRIEINTATYRNWINFINGAPGEQVYNVFSAGGAPGISSYWAAGAAGISDGFQIFYLRGQSYSAATTIAPYVSLRSYNQYATPIYKTQASMGASDEVKLQSISGQITLDPGTNVVVTTGGIVATAASSTFAGGSESRGGFTVNTSGAGAGLQDFNFNGGGLTGASINNSARIVRTSTIRMKKSVKPMTRDEAHSVLGLESYTFMMKKDKHDQFDDPRRYPGFIAEQAAKAGAELWVARQHDVIKDKKGKIKEIRRNREGQPIAFRTAEITVAHNYLIKELLERIEELEAKVAAA